MANQHQNGGRGALLEDNRSSWRPQDPSSPAATRDRGAEDDRGDYRAWRDRSLRDDERGRGGSEVCFEDRDLAGRSTERYGQGQSGYSAGRYGEDRSQQLHGRNAMIPSAGSFEDRYRDLGTDDRFIGRGRPSYWQERTGYEADRHGGYRGRDFEVERRELSRGHTGGHNGRLDERMSYPAGSYGGGHGGYGEAPGTQETTQRSAGSDSHVHRGTGPHRGKGPSGYQRSDERIRDMVCESLADDDQLDATHIEVAVSHGEVTLSGTVDDRRAKRDAEDCVWSVSGVRDVQNMVRVAPDDRVLARSNPSAQIPVGRDEIDTSAQDKKRRA